MEINRVLFTIWIRRLLLIVTLSFSVIWISENGLSYVQASTVQDFIDKGDSFYDQGRYEEAITYYDKALAIDPNDVDVLNNKGISLDSLGRHDEAITYYDKALAIDPNYVYALNNKGDTLHDLEKYDEAITYFDKILAINPNDTDALNYKGDILVHVGRYDEAITYLDKLLAIDPNDIDALNNKIAALGSLTPDFGPASLTNNIYHHTQDYTYVSNYIGTVSNTVTTAIYRISEPS